eukprot:760862-Hanusia_phi.AAC.2
MAWRQEYVKSYMRRTGRRSIPAWNFYLSFSFFRIAAILQGVYKRSLQGNASSDRAREVGALADQMTRMALKLSKNARSIEL